MNQCEILNQLPDVPLTLSDTDVSIYNSNKEYFDKYISKLQKYVEMDFDVESKQLKAAKIKIENVITEANIHKRLSDEIIKTNMMISSQQQSDDVSTSIKQMMSTCPNEFMHGEKIRHYQEELNLELNKANLCLKLCDTLRLYKYPQNENDEVNQLDKLIEKLNKDLMMLRESRDINKHITIKNIENAIDLIELIKINNIQYILNSITFDKRAFNLLKEANEEYIKKTFDRDIVAEFTSRLLVDTHRPVNHDLILLFIYQMTKKINTSMKSKDYKSLVYKACIVHYLDDINAGTDDSIYLSYIFLKLLDKYMENDKINKYVHKHENTMYLSMI